MKTTGLKFGFNAVQSGQKSATLNAVPQLCAKSTVGGFTITAPVSKALGIAVGEYITFLNNIDKIEQAIQQGNADVLAYAAEQGYDLNTVEGQQAVINDCAQWAIAKSVALVDASGNPLQIKVRVSAEEKKAYIEANGVSMINSMSDEQKAAFADARGVDMDDMEAMVNAISVDDIPSPMADAYSGSKTSASGNATGIGCQLSFTDTAIWNALKADVAEKDKVVRVFDVDLKHPETASIHNGKDYVQVLAYPITFAEDKAPARTPFNKDED